MRRKPPGPPLPFRGVNQRTDTSAPPTPAMLITGRITGTVLNPQREAILLQPIPPEDTIVGVVIVLATGMDENGKPKRVGMMPWTVAGLDRGAIMHTLRNMIEMLEAKSAKPNESKPVDDKEPS